MTRHDFLRQLSAVAAAAVIPAEAGAAAAAGLDLAAVQQAPGRVVVDEGEAAGRLRLVREWDGPRCRSKLVNPGTEAVHVREVVLFAIPHGLSPATGLYGEGFQMLTQTAGTLGAPRDLAYSDVGHYKLPQPEGAKTVYGLLTLSPPGDSPVRLGFTATVLLGFTSCRRFVGKLHVRPGSIEVVVETEGLALGPGQSWELEEFTVLTGPDRGELLDRLGDRIAQQHPPLAFPAPPAGWCSWYCFGPRVTAAQVLENLDFIAKEIPGLRYIQLDDGYQPAMGDWLEVGAAFGGDVRGVLEQIRKRGFEPAIWVAPFIAEAGSHLFQQHPDWFIRDEAGQPLPSNRVTFGGWRRGPWYAVDGTHPEAQRHLETVFRTMRRDWGCTYFKLDANFWGAMHGGRFHDPHATRVEAYRRGMEAVRRGTGDGFLLGCNHPIWPSFGLIHGSRSSGDIKRRWPTFASVARQNLFRTWQNGRLWWNDPDCATLSGDLPEAEYQFHATAVYASGGLILSGDDLPKLPPARLAMLRKLLPVTGHAARFADDSLRVGVIPREGGRSVCFFNWGESPLTLAFDLPKPARVHDFWSGEDLGRREGRLEVRDLPPHSARLLVCEDSV